MNSIGNLDSQPRVHLFGGKTPLEYLGNLSKRLYPARLWVKRDDLTELAFGGNKVRQLEFYLGQARLQNADTVLITGAVQSNFVRLAAAAANKLGMDCHIQLEQRVVKNDPLYYNNGNVLLDRVFGATIHYFPRGEDEAGADANILGIANQLKAKGKTPYIIPLAPGHPPFGALGYVAAAQEILLQLREQKIDIEQIILASGSGTTHAGLLFGLRAMGTNIKVTGICVRRNAIQQRLRIIERCSEIAGLLGIDNPVTESDVCLDDEFLGPGYGKSNNACLEAIVMAAQSEALLLDPTYTAKAMAGTISIARSAVEARNILFLHSGGTPAIFAYQQDIETAINLQREDSCYNGSIFEDERH